MKKAETPFRIYRVRPSGWEARHVDYNWKWGWGKTPFAALEHLKKNLKVPA